MKNLLKLWDDIERKLATATIAIAFVLTFIEVVARLGFNHSFYWAKEYIIFATVWSTFLGASQVLKKSRHIRLSVVVDLLPVKWQNYFDLFNIVLGIAFGLILTYSGFSLTMHALETGVTSTSLAKTPLWLPYSIMPLGGVLFTVRFIELFFATAGKMKSSADGKGVSGK
ncbi:MAG: TRAP transporter small permease [Acidaminococcales bacterium]|jgi:C4-dicarboxylate transporter DctQ subunit|nr:TRAP transporter small permease [Acidaminococcales bacterium]